MPHMEVLAWAGWRPPPRRGRRHVEEDRTVPVVVTGRPAERRRNGVGVRRIGG